MLQHPWTYEGDRGIVQSYEAIRTADVHFPPAMVHDTLGMRLNRVKVEVEEKTPSGEMKVYEELNESLLILVSRLANCFSLSQTMSFDLDPSHDGFWFEHRTSQFPHMAGKSSSLRIEQIPLTNE